jgi:hypothetical protein
MICPVCKYEGKAAKTHPGSFVVEVLLWLFLCVPGLFYSIWRAASVRHSCPRCGFRIMARFAK